MLLPLPFRDAQEYLTTRGIKWAEATDLREVAADVDVLYQVRVRVY